MSPYNSAPAARKGDAAKSASTSTSRRVAIPLPVTNSNQTASGSAGNGASSMSGTKPVAGSSGDHDISPTTQLNMRLNGQAAQFDPVHKPAPINFLNRGSTDDDDQPVIVSSTGPSTDKSENARGKMPATNLPPPPIGTRHAAPTSLIQPVYYTTDTGPQVPWLGGHYIKLDHISRDSFSDGMSRLFHEMNWNSKVIGQKSPRAGNSRNMEVFICFDNVDHAQAAENDVSHAALPWQVKHVTHTEYASADNPNGSRDTTSFFDGQVVFVATSGTSVNQNDTEEIRRTVDNLAKHFGDVLAFSESVQPNPSEWHWRVEFKAISSAHRALRENGKNMPYRFANWVIWAKQLPEPVSADTMLSCALSKVDFSPRKTADGTTMSPTGRTAWGVDADGNLKAVAGMVLPPKVEPPPANGDPASPSRGRFNSAPMGSMMSSYFGSIDANMDRSFSLNGLDSARSHRRVSEDSEPQMVVPQKIRDGHDVRTTLMLRNLPNGWSYVQMKERLDAVAFGKYDFSYLRIDFANNTNVGYAFVNFMTTEPIVDFVERYVGREWQPGHVPKKYAQVSYATIQGLDCLIEKFRNSAIMAEFPDFRPKLWWTHDDVPAGNCDEQDVGTEKAFPRPNNESKKQRSMDNAGTVGLYAPRNNRLGGERARRSNWDRGTSHQLQEDAAYHHAPLSPFDGNYALNGARPPPIGAPPQLMPMMPYAYPAMAHAAYFPSHGMGYAQYGVDPFSPYGGQYPGHRGFAVPHPDAYGPYAMQGTPASRLRTISQGRLGGRPTNVTVAEHGYSDPEYNRARANGAVPRSFAAAGEADVYGYHNAEGYADGNVSPGNAQFSRVVNHE